MPQPRFYNTLSHQVETFAPLEPGVVRMYNCGPTVYDFAHIGNFRAFVFADVLRRYLETLGLRVEQVMNITDVGHMTDDQSADGGGEDKMQVAGRRLKEAKKSGKALVENPDDPYQVARYYTQAFLEDAQALGLKIADESDSHMPRATSHIADMQAMIARLIERGHAYIAADGAVYYSVTSFPEYGRLSGNTLDHLRGGAGGRVLDEHQAGKKHPADFLLWKPDSTHLMKWDSPWGPGYPGWHIECSAMSTALLKRQVIDIHTGGEDNIFPHHECEIAQSVGAADEAVLHEHQNFRGFARFWMHTRFLLVDGEKMSKSKGNFYTIRDLLARGIDPAVVRYELLRSHYRANMNFTFKGLEDAASAVRRLRELEQSLMQSVGAAAASIKPGGPALQQPVVVEFLEALADDLNVSGALGALFRWAKLDHAQPAEALAALRTLDGILHVLNPQPSAAGDAVDTTELCRQIDAARQSKDYAAADRLRAQLNDAGYDVKNTPQGTVAIKRLA